MGLSSFKGTEAYNKIMGIEPRQRREDGTLNEIELKILEHLSYGLTNLKIAELLNIKPSSVETYRIRICRRLGTVNTCHAIAFAIRTKIIK
jgi:DNA-binding NarL/FixJ family response regulator